MCICISDICLVMISVLFPPLPVWIRRGFCSADSIINILLCTLGYLPGLIHSWYIITKYPPTQNTQKIYHIYRNSSNLERGYGQDTGCSHGHRYENSQKENQRNHHNGNPEEQGFLNNQQHVAGPSYNPSYGAISNNSNHNTIPQAAPPAYNELNNEQISDQDNKVQY